MITMIEPPVAIGARYTRDHVIRRDTQRGTFEEINSPVESSTERIAQRALFKPAPSNLDRLWNQKRGAHA